MRFALIAPLCVPQEGVFVVKKATLDISPELFTDLFSGEGYERTYTVRKNALPNDARIIYCRWVDETGGRVRLLIESETFEDVPDDMEPPRLLPIISTITGAIDDTLERAALEVERCDDIGHAARRIAAARIRSLKTEPSS